MPVGGIVISLVPDKKQRQAALEYLESQPDLEFGELCVISASETDGIPEQHRLPAVLDTLHADGAEGRIRELQAHAGIYYIDVVYIGFIESDEVPANPMDRPRRRKRASQSAYENPLSEP
jgi:hypothetical protein